MCIFWCQNREQVSLNSVPPENEANVQIFCDGAVDEDSNQLGIGCIAYNNVDESWRWDCSQLTNINDGDSPLAAEILAIEEAVEMAY